MLLPRPCAGRHLGLGSMGMLLTGTLLVVPIEASSWRTGFWVLAGMLGRGVAGHRRPWCASPNCRPAVRASRWARRCAPSARCSRRTRPASWRWGLVTYASFVERCAACVPGPMLMQRHGYSLVDSGNVAVLMMVIALIGPPLFWPVRPWPGAAPALDRRLHLRGGGPVRPAGGGYACGRGRRPGARHRPAVGLHGAAVPDVKGAYAPAAGARHGPVHHGDVPRRGADAVDHRHHRGRLRRRMASSLSWRSTPASRRCR